MAVSRKTTDEVVEQLIRWQRKHRLQDGQMEELLRWLQKAKDNQSFITSLVAIHDAYKQRRDHVKLPLKCKAELSATTPTTVVESPILAFERWLLRWVEDHNRKLTQDEYSIAYSAFIAAHPGEGPQSHVMAASSRRRNLHATIIDKGIKEDVETRM